MVKVIESGYLRAEVDTTDIDNPKITITTIQPIVVHEYHKNFDIWQWEGEIAMDARTLYSEVDEFIFRCRRMRMREKLFAAMRPLIDYEQEENRRQKEEALCGAS